MKKLLALVLVSAFVFAGCSKVGCKTDADCKMTDKEKSTYFGD